VAAEVPCVQRRAFAAAAHFAVHLLSAAHLHSAVHLRSAAHPAFAVHLDVACRGTAADVQRHAL